MSSLVLADEFRTERAMPDPHTFYVLRYSAGDALVGVHWSGIR